MELSIKPIWTLNSFTAEVYYQQDQMNIKLNKLWLLFVNWRALILLRDNAISHVAKMSLQKLIGFGYMIL